MIMSLYQILLYLLYNLTAAISPTFQYNWLSAPAF